MENQILSGKVKNISNNNNKHYNRNLFLFYFFKVPIQHNQ